MKSKTTTSTVTANDDAQAVQIRVLAVVTCMRCNNDRCDAWEIFESASGSTHISCTRKWWRTTQASPVARQAVVDRWTIPSQLPAAGPQTVAETALKVGYR